MSDKRILIADADPTAWEVFHQALGEAWIVVGAFSGPAALAEAQKQPFDVVVANFSLPEMDGAELLNQLRVSAPKTLRFIAAEESQREKVISHVVGGHQFLGVPYEKESLKAAVERSLAQDYGMSQSMRELVGRIRTFPTIPSLYLEVVNALKKPSATTEDIGLIIGKDMAMTTKLVQVLNSAYYGLPRTITDPTEAVGILGFETVKSLIMTVKMLSQYDKVKPVYFSIDSIWKHSTVVAKTAKAMVMLETGDPEISGIAYTAGLMHDLGKVILAANFDGQYSGAHSVARKQKIPLWDVEKDIFGADHGEIGAYLLGLWGMSPEVVKIAAMHHHPQRAEDTGFTALTAVHVANALEYEGNTATDELPVPLMDAAYLQRIGLEGRVEAWRDVQRDPEASMFETRMMHRSKSAAKSVAKPVLAAPAPAPAPKINKFAPADVPKGPLMWHSVLKWAGLGLGFSAVLALLAWLETMRLERTNEKPELLASVEHPPPPVKHEMAKAVEPAKAVQESKPPPAPPAKPIPEWAAQPPPEPAPAPPAPPAPKPAPEKSAFDRLKLEAIFFSATHPSALINGQLASVNQQIEECRVLDISRSTVTVEYKNQRKVLNLQ